MKKSVWILIFWICLVFSISNLVFCSPVYALYGLRYFYADIGARPLALGGAFTGLANDETSCFYNPGGLPWSKGVGLFTRDAFNLAAFEAYPTGTGQAYGLAVFHSNVTNFQATSTNLGDFSSNVLYLSAGTKLSALPILESIPQAPNIGIGANFKAVVSQTLRLAAGSSDATAQGWDLDLGAMYKPLPWFSVGANLQNLLPATSNTSVGGIIEWNNGDLESVPAVLLTGLSAKLVGDAKSPVYIENNEVTLVADARMQREAYGIASLGLEWGYQGFLFVRTGYNSNTADQSFGVGLRGGDWGVDLASFSDYLKKERCFAFAVSYNPQEWVFEKRVAEKKYKAMTIVDPVASLIPTDETVTYEESIPVKGKVKKGIEVYINGQGAYVDGRGKFSNLVPLSPGKNLLIIDLYYADEKLTFARKVLRKPKIIIAEEKQMPPKLKEKVEGLVMLGVIDVEPRAEFAINAPVTRGELASWLVKSANIPITRVTASPFADVPAKHKYAPYIKAAAAAGLMQGEGKRFYPDRPVTKSEAQEIFKKFGAIR